MKKFRPGITFSDFLIQDSATHRSKIKDPGVTSQIPVGTWVWVLTLIGFGLLVMRLGSLQLLQGGKYRVLADENRLQKITIPAPRGTIYDRHGVVLAKTVNNTRQYPLGPAAAHVIGYVGEANDTEVGLLKSTGGKYELKDYLGRSGIEQQYETVLRGTNGGQIAEVNSDGSIARNLGKQVPVPGQDMHLTIDADLQKVASEALGDKRGAVVAANPKTGEILVLASSPSFDPTNVAPAMTNTDLPLLNRAIGGLYAPGSTFKMITTIAGMTDGGLSPEFTYDDTGAIRVGTFSYTNWFYTQYGGTEGEIGWSRALTRSTDTFFYKVGELTGAANLAKWAKVMGLGDPTGIDLPGEVAGLVPTPDWKWQVKGEQWYLGNTYHMAIGQEDTLVTPIQINQMTNILASGGSKCTPHLIMSDKQDCDQVDIPDNILQIVKAGMIGACSPGGTAFPLYDFNATGSATFKVACKTGTAQYVRPDGTLGEHAWLTAYAPADDPTISVTALVEGGGEGSYAAAPIARKVLIKYFGLDDHFNYAAIAGQGE